MTKPYRKRAQNSWQAGKGRKGQSDREERQHAKREIRQAVAETDPGYLERHHKGARTKNEMARLEDRVRRLEQTVSWRVGGDWLWNYFSNQLSAARAKLRRFMRERGK